MKSLPGFFARPAALVAALACQSESDDLTFDLQAHSFANSEWSQPVNLGPVVNSNAPDMNATFSPDGLSLYFTSTRTGGLGGTDIWVAQRGCTECPWTAPVNAGAPINSGSNDGAPHISVDGHLLFFFSARVPEGGLGDVYLSRRVDPKDDFGWSEPVRLGPEVNTEAWEAGPDYLQNAEGGLVNLYFSRQPVGGQFDIWVVTVERTGEIQGLARPVGELNTAFSDAGPSLRRDGRELFFFSTRSPSLGMGDLWVARRRSVADRWSAPEHLAALSSAANDRQPRLSSDGRTLIFASNRLGGEGLDDLWMSTRTVSGN